MARNQRELQRAFVEGMEALGFPNPAETIVVQCQWRDNDLILHARFACLKVNVRNNTQTVSPHAQCTYNEANSAPNEKLVVWARETAARDALTLVYTEVVRCRSCRGLGKSADGRDCPWCRGVGAGGPKSFDWPADFPTPHRWETLAATG